MTRPCKPPRSPRMPFLLIGILLLLAIALIPYCRKKSLEQRAATLEQYKQIEGNILVVVPIKQIVKEVWRRFDASENIHPRKNFCLHCTSFVGEVFRKYDVKLPDDLQKLREKTQAIDPYFAEIGDLVLLDDLNQKDKIWGIIVENHPIQGISFVYEANLSNFELERKNIPQNQWWTSATVPDQANAYKQLQLVKLPFSSIDEHCKAIELRSMSNLSAN